MSQERIPETDQHHAANGRAPEHIAADSGAPGDAASADAQNRQSAAPELPEGEMSFAELFELAEKQAQDKKKAQKREKAPQKRVERDQDVAPGQVLEARIVSIAGESVFLDIGGKAEGVVDKRELANDEGVFTGKEGDEIEVRVLSASGGQIKLGKVLAHQSAKNRESIRQAFEAQLPVEGKVTGLNKGGLDFQIGGLRAFLPMSQVDLRPVGNLAHLVGQKFPVRITEYKDGGRNIVVSRRALLAEEQKKKSGEIMATISEGQRLKGRVTSVKDYGAFVDLGGVEGLVHLSELSHAHVPKASDVLTAGQEIEVSVLKIEDKKDGGKKISLSMKALAEDPWQRAQRELKVGQKVTGKVQRIQKFGAFVELFPGVDGLIHVSNMSNQRVNDPSEVVSVGSEVEATIHQLDWEKRRIGLSLVKSAKELASSLHRDDVLEGEVDSTESFGVFVKLSNGARGLVPVAETGTPRGADLKKEFPRGTKLKVAIKEIDAKGKIRLSVKAVAEAEERAEFQTYVKGSEAKGFGTLADLFSKKR